MYLYTRTGTANRSKMLEATAWASEIAAKVNSITGLGVNTWAVTFGAPINTIVWSALIEAPADMAAAGDKLLADPSYVDAVTGAAELWDSPPEDTMVELVTITGEPPAEPAYASLVRAECAPGKVADAMAWGVDMANHAHSVTGRPGSFGRSLYGPWGQVGWFSLADSAEQIDAATAALSADPTYLEKIDQGGPFFTPGSVGSRLSRRIA